MFDNVPFLVSNNDSFDNLYKFSNNKKDWLFGYISYDVKNEIENLSSKNLMVLTLVIYFFCS